MDLFVRIEQLLVPLRPVFRRQATYLWFVLLVYGMLLRRRLCGVSSCLEALGLGEPVYHQALHFFRSTAFTTHDLMKAWHEQLAAHPFAHTLNGRKVYAGDGIKIPKEGRHMPGVKRLHQESQNNTKPTWIRGHYFGAIGLLLRRGKATFHLPVYCQLQDGLTSTGQEKDGQSLVDKMGTLAKGFLPRGAYLVLDAYYAAKALLREMTQQGIDVITRAKLSTVAYRPLPPPPKKRGRGRPRKWGERVKLKELFEQATGWVAQELILYGDVRQIRWQILDLHWHCPTQAVRFVLAHMDNGKRLILLSTDLTLSGPQILEAYTWRFKIEVCFGTLISLLSGFGYRFWSKAMARAPRWPSNQDLSEVDESVRKALLTKVESFERFVNLQGLALGVLQVLSLEMSSTIWDAFPGWFRTLPMHGLASEQVVRMTLQDQAPAIFAGVSPSLLLWKFREAKRGVPGPRPHRASSGESWRSLDPPNPARRSPIIAGGS
jgi:hypothetical protein